MRDSESHGDRLDAAIDRAVRDLMHVEPRTDLRERVLARIGSRAPGFSAWPRLATAAALIAIVAFAAVMLSRRPDSRQPEQTMVTAQPTVVSAPSDAGKPPSRPPQPVEGPSTNRGRAVAVPAVQDRLVQAASIDLAGSLDNPADVESRVFEGLAPIHIPPIQTVPIATSVTSIVPITIERIDLVPLKR